MARTRKAPTSEHEVAARKERLRAARQAWSDKQANPKGKLINSSTDYIDRAGFVRTGYDITIHDLRKDEIESLLAQVYSRIESEDDFCETEINRRSENSRLDPSKVQTNPAGVIEV